MTPDEEADTIKNALMRWAECVLRNAEPEVWQFQVIARIGDVDVELRAVRRPKESIPPPLTPAGAKERGEALSALTETPEEA